MPFNIDMAAIIIMESLGVVSFAVALLFLRQRQRVRNKQRAFVDALSRRLISERGNGKCYSSEWVMDNIVYRRKKILDASPLVLVTLTFVLAVFYYLVGPHILSGLIGFGYTSMIALLTISVLLWTDAFEAYGYAGSINEVAISQLDKEDQSYMELAREALEKAVMRFASLGFAFALLGPFIPLIFNDVVYVLVLYAAVFFQTSEVLFKFSTVVGVAIVLIIPVLMFFLPELLWRIMIQKVKPLASRILARKKG